MALATGPANQINHGDFAKMLKRRLTKGARVYLAGCAPGEDRKGYKMNNVLQALSSGLGNHLVIGSSDTTYSWQLGPYQQEDVMSHGVPAGNDFYSNGIKIASKVPGQVNVPRP